jgi:hypothetical protein
MILQLSQIKEYLREQVLLFKEYRPKKAIDQQVKHFESYLCPHGDGGRSPVLELPLFAFR